MALSIENSMGDDWYSLTGGTSWASVEGLDHEWLAMADALRSGRKLAFRRLAFYPIDSGGGHMCSPRNSQEGDEVRLYGHDAAELADEIVRVLERDGRPCLFQSRGFDPIAMGC